MKESVYVFVISESLSEGSVSWVWMCICMCVYGLMSVSVFSDAKTERQLTMTAVTHIQCLAQLHYSWRKNTHLILLFAFINSSFPSLQ